jgi:hypothetical protein
VNSCQSNPAFPVNLPCNSTSDEPPPVVRVLPQQLTDPMLAALAAKASLMGSALTLLR